MFDRMPPEKLARAKGQAATTNRRNKLALDANGFGVGRPAKQAAEAQLIRELGSRRAKKLIKGAADKVCKGGWF